MFLIVLTLLDSVMGVYSTATQRLLAVLLLVAPTVSGAVFGFLSLVRKEGRTLSAGIGMFLNAIFALFNLMIVFIAG